MYELAGNALGLYTNYYLTKKAYNYSKRKGMDVFDYIKHGPRKAGTLSKGRGNLRGTRMRTNPKSYLSTQAQLNQLRAAINRNVAELQTYRQQAQTATRTGTGVEETIDISLSELITGDANFRENVLGDKFRMKYYSINFATNCDKLRVIVYKPKEPGQKIDISVLTNGLIDHTEPNAFNILHDRLINVQSTNRSDTFHFSTAKRVNFMTTINSQASDIVKSGDLRLLVVTQGGASDTVVYSTMMKFQNK